VQDAEVDGPVLEAAEGGEVALGARHRAQDRLGVRGQRRPRLGRPHAVGPALEQLQARFALEPRHGLRDGGLHEMQVACRLGHAAELHGGGERAEVTELHHGR
jgi:hypothetical protein